MDHRLEPIDTNYKSWYKPTMANGETTPTGSPQPGDIASDRNAHMIEEARQHLLAQTDEVVGTLLETAIEQRDPSAVRQFISDTTELVDQAGLSHTFFTVVGLGRGDFGIVFNRQRDGTFKASGLALSSYSPSASFIVLDNGTAFSANADPTTHIVAPITNAQLLEDGRALGISLAARAREIATPAPRQ